MASTDPVASLLNQLRGNVGVLGVILFGSMARRESRPTSDVDVIVVHDAETSVHTLRLLVRPILLNEKNPDRIKVSYFTPRRLCNELEKFPSFGAHLTDEGRVLHRKQGFSAVESCLNSLQLNTTEIRRELATRVEKLSLFSDTERFNGQFVPCLGHLYAIGRSVVILKLLENDVHEYSWQRMFDTYSTIRPDLKKNIRWLEALRPYYDHMRNRSELADDYREINERHIGATVASIQALAGA